MSTETQPQPAPPQEKKASYKETLNLPQTAFSMEAKLVQNEPARLKRWQESSLYQRIQGARAASPKGKWVLHDGPPFANGDIHIGHLINKTLKDVFIRFRTMQGYHSPYVPGWDCHGLPIEHKIQEKFKGKLREMSTVEVRRHCFEYASHYVKVQSEQFQRLGILGEWNNPYLTMSPDYEASTLEVFARFVENGLVYRQLKPVSWSVSNQTALAEAELEYKDVEDPSVYVEFPVSDVSKVETAMGGTGKLSGLPVAFLVWTTTPWTLPANLAIAANPQVEYTLATYQAGNQTRAVVLATELLETVAALRPGTQFTALVTATGEKLLGLEYRHPFINRTGRIVAADYVTTTDGTGLVHTAPGHGEEDYETGIREGLETYSPVLANGRFDDTAPDFIKGQTVWDANPLITQRLRDQVHLFAEVKITHSYPHDWRSKKPIIYRATEQWFISVEKPFVIGGENRDGSGFRSPPEKKGDGSYFPSRHSEQGSRATALGLRDRAKRAAEEDIKFIPDWGRARLLGMLESRPDWCISRQRAWGLPIPVFYNEKGQPLLTKESVLAVARRFREHGSDAWFTLTAAQLLADFDPGPEFPKDKLRKEQDIFDVWFESGNSWHAVLQKRDYLTFPADLYLEGSDQHRGWFQLSLLPSLGYTGQSPFKSVLTHGFAVKPDGTKVSKSDKEYVTATEEVNRHGADVLRLWCCSVDYQYDLPTSPQMIKEFGDKYRKIRNTLRYLLSNLYDFNPNTDAVADIPASTLDGWASAQLDTLVREVTAAYDRYALHNAFRLLHDFCAVQFSAVYGNAMKDRLYCEAPDSPVRRRSQAVMYRAAVALTKLLAPMLVFTADEAWEHLKFKPEGEQDADSVHLTLLPEVAPAGAEGSPGPTEQQDEEWRLVMDLRDKALLQLDRLKKEVGMNKALDAEVIFKVDDPDLKRRLESYGVDLADMVGAGYHSFAEKGPEGPAVEVQVVDRRETYKACARSWKRRPDVGADPEYPDLSLRDALAVKSLKK
jgi:isoleucyl-tRNA synthetase